MSRSCKKVKLKVIFDWFQVESHRVRSKQKSTISLWASDSYGKYITISQFKRNTAYVLTCIAGFAVVADRTRAHVGVVERHTTCLVRPARIVVTRVGI